MDKQLFGFSLVESLLALVVLSVGMLGLGELQVRLLTGATALHTADIAFLLGENLLETAAPEWLDGPAPAADRSPGPVIHARLTRHRAAPPDEFLVAAQAGLRWGGPGREQTLVLTRTRDTRLDARDTRWLLAPR